MQHVFRTLGLVLALALAPFHLPAAAQAQNLFAPVARVNDRVITAYERDQRARLVTLFRTPGDPQELALRALIDERLELQAAAAMNITVSDEDVAGGIEEFAGRVNLSQPELLQALGQSGIDIQTLEDFVRAGIAWRQVVRARFGQKSRLNEAEIDRAITEAPRGGGIRVLLSEIILPANTPQAAADANRRAAELTRVTSIDAFSDAARRFSAAPSRTNGGKIEWTPLGDLPPGIASLVVTLKPGQVTAPLPIPNAIALFQLRALEETRNPTPPAAFLEYAAFYIPGGQSAPALQRAAEIRARVDTCDDLYGVAKGLPANVLERDKLPAAQVPADVAIELAKLDKNEVSTGLTRANGQTLVFLMLCERTYRDPETVDRRAIGEQKSNQRASGYADSYLAELRANATIVIE